MEHSGTILTVTVTETILQVQKAIYSRTIQTNGKTVMATAMATTCKVKTETCSLTSPLSGKMEIRMVMVAIQTA